MHGRFFEFVCLLRVSKTGSTSALRHLVRAAVRTADLQGVRARQPAPPECEIPSGCGAPAVVPPGDPQNEIQPQQTTNFPDILQDHRSIRPSLAPLKAGVATHKKDIAQHVCKGSGLGT